jgi:hypothetical protein
MRLRTALAAGSFGLIFLLGLLQAQRPFREYPAIEYDDFPLPSDWKDHEHEWVRARLRYPDIYGYPDRSRLRLGPGRPWPGQWTMDYPRADRHLLEGVRRLTRIDARSVEQVVDLDGTDDVSQRLPGRVIRKWLRSVKIVDHQKAAAEQIFT